MIIRYAECYPGLAEMDDAVIDSDDEADFSKMDMGNKKGPVGRWVQLKSSQHLIIRAMLQVGF